MGFICPERQTTSDFLTSLTSPLERIARDGWEARVPQSPDEFEQRWLQSADHARLVQEIDAYNQEFPIDDSQHLATFQNARRAQQAKHQRIESPYTISITMQIKLCMRRALWRLQGDMTLLLTGVIGNSVMCLIVASVFYNLKNDTSSLFNRGALLFFSILLNAFSSMLEVCEQSPHIEPSTYNVVDSNFVRPTPNCREASKIRFLPPRCGSRGLYDLRSATEDRNFNHYQLDHLFHDQLTTDSGSVLYILFIQLRGCVGYVYGFPFHWSIISNSIRGYGSFRCSYLSTCHLYRIHNPCEGHATLVSMDQLFESGGIRFRSFDDQ